ncbi:hypothetical protein [Facklamia miroungae]|uniref:Uncharacterized protein n=1 Tax=Facklamia miroungae TaxID=120956 RepID=A0A1G7TIM0_9LACT|nr:hypothetical protein [Facklamia miroungae]NKZ29827.1 hypothetical protein [Facklamia miroungae]SDG34962.1 hypothetical protein SAMN05421791_10627 [Facklamia miroungae]
MATPSNFNSNFEEEINKHIEEIDRRVDRTGWPLLIIGVIIFFLLVYLSVKAFSIPTTKEYEGSQAAMNRKVEDLEKRITSLEALIEGSQE